MFKKIFKFIWRLIIFILILLFFFAVIRPAYINYKQNKKEVIVDQSGERATSKNKLKDTFAFSLSIPITYTSTISPTLNTSLGCFI